MRLTDHEKITIGNAISLFVRAAAELRLYGSRVDDHKKGGDIDLLLIVDDSKQLQFLKQNKFEIFAEIYQHIPEQKIDLLIVDPEKVNSDAFVKMIYPSSIVIYRWNSDGHRYED